MRRDFVHHVQHDRFENRAQAARAGFLFVRFPCHRDDRIVREPQLHFVERQQFLILLDQRILRFGHDADQRLLVELIQGRADREPADEFWYQAVLEQVFRLHL